jgi:hypothetical protein
MDSKPPILSFVANDPLHRRTGGKINRRYLMKSELIKKSIICGK